MKAFLLACILLISSFVLAQEQPSGEPARSDKIADARRNLTDYFLDSNVTMVSQYVKYLCFKLESDDYLALYPEEKWLLYVFLGEYDSLFQSITLYDKRNLDKIPPEPDILYEKLLEKTALRRNAILLKAQSLGLNSEQRAFLPLLFDYCFLDTKSQTISQEQLNDSASRFMNIYPNAVTNPFIRNYIQYILVLKPWSFGFDLGGSLNIVTGDMYKTFSHQGGLCVGFDASYRKFTGFLRLNLDFGRTRDSVLFSDYLWEKHKPANNILCELSLSYPLNVNKRTRLLPFAGIGTTRIYPENPNQTDDDTYAENPYSLDAFCWVGGINFDYRFGKTYLITENEIDFVPSSFYIRFRYSLYVSQFTGDKIIYNGYVHNISVSVFGLFERMKYIQDNK